MDPVFITSRNMLCEFAGWDFLSDLHTNIFICRVAKVIWNEAKTLFIFHDFLKPPGGFIFSKVVGTINPATLLRIIHLVRAQIFQKTNISYPLIRTRNCTHTKSMTH